MSSKKLSAALAGLSLLWGTALAQSSEPVQAPEAPVVIILELQSTDPELGEALAADPSLLGTLLMQLLSQLEAATEQRELIIAPPNAPARGEPGIGI